MVANGIRFSRLILAGLTLAPPNPDNSSFKLTGYWYFDFVFAGLICKPSANRTEPESCAEEIAS